MQTFTEHAGALVRDADPGKTQQDQDTGPAEDTQEAREAEKDTALDVTSAADLLHMLERVAGRRPELVSGT